MDESSPNALRETVVEYQMLLAEISEIWKMSNMIGI